MFLLLDLIVIAVFIACIVIGYKNGVIKAVANLFGGIISFFAAKYVASALYVRCAGFLPMPKPGQAISEKINSIFLHSETSQTVGSLLNKLGLPESLTNQLASDVGSAAANTAADAVEKVTEALGLMLTYCLLFILAFVVCMLLIRVLCVWLNVFNKFPILRTVNRVLGAILGVIGGVLAAWIAAVILAWLLPTVCGTIGLDPASIDTGRTFVFQYLSAFNPLSVLF